jgi:hypothetical protein
MAQWRGQFTGLTHETKLADAEATLRTAVAAFRAAAPAKSKAKAKAVRQLAEQVLRLRLKLLKARRDARGPRGRASAEWSKAPEREVIEAGVAAILTEFDAADLP